MKNKPVILAVDSANKFIKTALYFKDKIYQTQKHTIKQERYLFKMIDKLLLTAGICFKDINTVCVLKGPGRFTGIRIGLTLAGIMQKLQHCKVFSINLLCASAFESLNTEHFKKWRSKNKNGLIASVMHAFREEFYLQFFKAKEKNIIIPCAKPLWLDRQQLNEKIKNIKTPLFITGWAENYAHLNSIIKNTKFSILKPCSSGLNIKTLVEMVKKNICLCENLKPLYLKKARFEL